MMRRELLHQCRGQPVPHHQEEGDHDVVVSLVVVQLGVALEDVEDDVNELLLQYFPLVIRHVCGNSRGGTAVSPTSACCGSKDDCGVQGAPVHLLTCLIPMDVVHRGWR